MRLSQGAHTHLYSLFGLFHCIPVQQGHCATPKTSSRHTRPIHPLFLPLQSNLNQLIQFLTAHFIVIPVEKQYSVVYTVVYYGTLWFTVVYCGLLWYTVVYCGTLWFTVVYCGLLWYTVVYCGILQFTVVHCGLRCTKGIETTTKIGGIPLLRLELVLILL